MSYYCMNDRHADGGMYTLIERRPLMQILFLSSLVAAHTTIVICMTVFLGMFRAAMHADKKEGADRLPLFPTWRQALTAF
jgi:hypothetical protein